MKSNDNFIQVGEYNKAVGEPFKLPHDPDSAAILIISTPNMFDVSFKRWFLMKCKEFGSVEAVAENVSSPIQEFLQYRLEPLCKKFDDLDVEYELLHDHSLWANRKPKILMQTCGHISGAAFYYQPFQVGGEGWPPYLPKGKKKFIGLSLHPIYGGHFAFRSVFIFPKLRLVDFCAPKPLSILHSQEEIRDALERFNYSWQDSGFRDFGCPLKRYSTTQMEFFGVPPSERWEILRQWYEEP
ncbi:MMACHC-like family protein [Ancylostoma caninum]|uniref:Cyanocobalamin reductase (cyanide-eliminating) n=1 Tax=Ancylostoma caninum TaxID=29170 RepID=A0A368GTR2_ANCCA|nr:MMACHC-like family protein [Ancylostoma caninum]